MCGAAHSTIKPENATRHFFLPALSYTLPVRLLPSGGNLNNDLRPFRAACFSLLLLTLPSTSATQQNPPPATAVPLQSSQDWPRYGGNPEGIHFSELAQINRTNVTQLQVAWTFDTAEPGGLQTNPLIVKGVLYGITPTQKIFALDAATGKPISDFGDNGRIDLRQNLGREPASANSIVLTSPGVVFEDLIIVGGCNPETLPAPPGNIRAFEVRTGKLRWSFHTIPQPGEFGYDTWPPDAWKTTGAANN